MVRIYNQDGVYAGIPVGRGGVAPEQATLTGWVIRGRYGEGLAANDSMMFGPNNSYGEYFYILDLSDPNVSWFEGGTVGGVPFATYADADAYILLNDWIGDLSIDGTVEIISATDPSFPSQFYNYNLDMAYPGLTIRWESDADDPNKAIMGSAAEVSFYVDEAQEAIITQAAAQNVGRRTCLYVYKKDPTGQYQNWWQGEIIEESVTFEVREGKRLCDMSFACGLAALYDKTLDEIALRDYMGFSGEPIKPMRSLANYFTMALYQTQAVTDMGSSPVHFNDGSVEEVEMPTTFVDHDLVNRPGTVSGLVRLVPGYTGPVARITNSVTMSPFVDVYADTDLTPYDGYKVMFTYNQMTTAPAFYNFIYTQMPSVDAAAKTIKFDGTQYMNGNVGVEDFSGNSPKTVLAHVDITPGTAAKTIFSQGDASTTTSAEIQHYSNSVAGFSVKMGSGTSYYDLATGSTLGNHILTAGVTASSPTSSDWTVRNNGSNVALSSSSGTQNAYNILTGNLLLGARTNSGTLESFFTGSVGATIVYDTQLPTASALEDIEADLKSYFVDLNTGTTNPYIPYYFNTYGTPLPVREGNDQWDVSSAAPLRHIYASAQSFVEPKEKTDRKFELPPISTLPSIGEVIEDICKTLGMTLTHWNGGYHLFNRNYLTKSSKHYTDFPDVDMAPHAWRWRPADLSPRYADVISDDGLHGTAVPVRYEQVHIDGEYEDYAAPADGMVKKLAMPYRGVQLEHYKSPSDILYGKHQSVAPTTAYAQTTHHKITPPATWNANVFEQFNISPDDYKRYGDYTTSGALGGGWMGHELTAINRKRRQGSMWTMTGAYYQDGFSYDANGGAQGSDLSPRAQHKRLEDGVTGGGPNPTFFDGRYIGPDSATLTDIALEAGESLSLEMGAYVENGRLDEHIGQTYIFRHRVEVRQDDGTKYRLRRHVITQDTWTDNGTKRAILIDGSNSDVDKTWAGDRDYYIKEYGTLEWVHEDEVSPQAWEDCWYEVMTFHPETTKTEGEDLAETDLTALPYYGNAPMGTTFDEAANVLKVNKENRFSYVKADLSIELPGTAGVDGFSELYTECGIACYGPSQGPRAVHGFAGANADFCSRKADGSVMQTPTGAAVSGTAGSTIDMPYVMGWNKWVIRYGDQGEKNTLTSYADGGGGSRVYDAGGSRVASRFVFNSPEFKGRLKVEYQNPDGSFTDKTFNTQWRPQQNQFALTQFVSSIHELTVQETLDIIGTPRIRYQGSWVKHPGTTQGGCPPPFLPRVARCLDPVNAVLLTPYRMRWSLSSGFQMEAVKIGDVYSRSHTVLEVGDVGTGASGGGSSASLTRLGAIGSQAGQAALRPQFEALGSSDTSVGGGTHATFGTFNYMTGTDDGTGIFYEELWATNPAYISGAGGYSHKFDIVDGTNLALYGGGNVGRMVVQEPGLYMVEIKGRLDNATTIGTSNTYGFAMHRLGTVANNTYTGDTTLKTSNIIENMASKINSNGTGNYLSGVWAEQVALGRGDVITFSTYSTSFSGGNVIYNSPEQLKIRLVKLTEQPG